MAQQELDRTDHELLSKIRSTYSDRISYSQLLVEQVYPTLTSIGTQNAPISHEENSFIQDSAFELSYLNEKLCETNSDVIYLQRFYEHVRTIIRKLLFSRFKAKKDSTIDSSFLPNGSINIIDLDNAIIKLSHMDKRAADALFILFYNGKSVTHIAYILDITEAEVTVLINQGKKVLKALLNGISINH